MFRTTFLLPNTAPGATLRLVADDHCDASLDDKYLGSVFYPHNGDMQDPVPTITLPSTAAGNHSLTLRCSNHAGKGSPAGVIALLTAPPWPPPTACGRRTRWTRCGWTRPASPQVSTWQMTQGTQVLSPRPARAQNTQAQGVGMHALLCRVQAAVPLPAPAMTPPVRHAPALPRLPSAKLLTPTSAPALCHRAVPYAFDPGRADMAPWHATPTFPDANAHWIWYTSGGAPQAHCDLIATFHTI